MKDEYKDLSIDDLKAKLNCSEEGLSTDEAKKRIDQSGYNELPEKKTNVFLKILSYFWGPIPWMLEIAVILSAVVRHWPDFFIILLLLVSNSLVSFWEEWNAGNEIAALRAKLALKARVNRGREWIEIEAREIVPGDVVRLRAGDIVPADAKLIGGDPIQLDQSVLTGESLPATANPGDAIYSGSIISQGEATVLVYGTGVNTYFGKTAQLVQDAKTTSHFEKAVLKIGNYLIALTLTLVAAIVIFSIVREDPVLGTIQFALVLTIAGIPIAMPTVLSVTMAIGARLLAKKQVVVTRLVAIEELAGVDILCADKTGTLTQNTLTLGEPFVLKEYTEDDLMIAASLASRKDNNDTIDNAILSKTKEGLLEGMKVSHFTPFDPVHKRTEADVEGKFKVSKGAPQVILELCKNSGEVKDQVEKAVGEFAAKGFRSLGVARTKEGGEWEFLGVLSLFDPPCEEAKATIATAGEMGVKVKMVTGDQVAIAKETAKVLGMGTDILEASCIDQKNCSTSLDDADGFAQVFPEHKFHIVEAYQKEGHIVGMTGDGVNDAPALKKADCGVAVSNATDTARASASIVLLKTGLGVIIDAIKESRKIFQRMNSYTIFRIAATITIVFFMALSILAFNFYPLDAVMIVMLALLNDGAIISIAYDNVHYKNMPEEWNMKEVLGISTILGVIGIGTSFGLFYLAETVFKIDREHIQTMMYLFLSVSGHLTIFVTRTRGPFWSICPAKILLIAVFGTQALATFISVYGFLMHPIGWMWAGVVWGYALAFFFVMDVVKWTFYKCIDKKSVSKASGIVK